MGSLASVLEKVDQETQEPENLVGIRQYGGEVFAWGLTDLTVFSSGKELRQLSIFSKTFGLPKHVKDENGRSNPTGRDTAQCWSFLVKTDLTSTSLSTSLSLKPGVFRTPDSAAAQHLHPLHLAGHRFSGIQLSGAIAELRSLQVFHRSGQNGQMWGRWHFIISVTATASEHQWTRSLKALRMTESGLNHGYITVSTAIHCHAPPKELESSVMSMLPELYRPICHAFEWLRRCASMLCSFGPSPFPYFPFVEQKVNRKDTRHHWTSLDTTRNWVRPPRQRISSLLYAKLVREVELFSGCAKRCLLTTDRSQLFRWGYTLAPLPERNCLKS